MIRYALATLLALPLTAMASGPVIVTLTRPADSREAERCVIDVRMRNEGNTPVYLFIASTVGYEYIANVFCIRDASGKPAAHKTNPGKIIWSKDAFVPIAP